MKGDGELGDLQEVCMISDLELKADEMGKIKRAQSTVKMPVAGPTPIRLSEVRHVP